MFISFVRTIILYFTIILAVRVMGKRQINQLQTSELVVTLLISDLAVIPMQRPAAFQRAHPHFGAHCARGARFGFYA